jgi:hypothetical protein
MIFPFQAGSMSVLGASPKSCAARLLLSLTLFLTSDRSHHWVGTGGVADQNRPVRTPFFELYSSSTPRGVTGIIALECEACEAGLRW